MHGRVTEVKKQLRRRDKVLVPITLLLTIGFGVVLTQFGMAQKWDAAACWTIVPFSVAIPMYYRYWSGWRFWAAWAICFLLQVGLMWLIFAKLLAGVVRMGTLYVVPFEFVEIFVLLLAIGLVMRALGQKDKWIRL
jgi:hypothetical protein